MKKFILIFITISIISSLFIIPVNAVAVEDEEVIIENNEITETTETTDNELINTLIEKVEMTNFILVFMIIIHYVEKWLKLYVSGFEKHLR